MLFILTGNQKLSGAYHLSISRVFYYDFQTPPSGSVSNKYGKMGFSKKLTEFLRVR